jgi:hypothetical protein
MLQLVEMAGFLRIIKERFFEAQAMAQIVDLLVR